VPASFFWVFLSLQLALVIILALLGIKYVLLILIGVGALSVCFAGRLPAILLLIAVSPVVFLQDISPAAIRAGKWAFVIVLVLTWFLGKILRGEKIFVPRTSVNFFVICMLSWGALISLYALNPVESLLNLLRLLSLFGLFYLFADVLRDRQDILKTVGVWVTVGVLVSLTGMYQYRLSMIRYGGGRVAATFENPNALGIFLFLLLPVVLSLFFLRREALKRLGLGITLLLLLLCLLWTGSRSSWLAAYVALVSFGFIAKKRYLVVPLVVLGALLGIVLSSSLLSGGLYDLLRFGRGFAFRPILWGISWRIFLDHPLLGVGFGGIPTLFQSYYPVSALPLYKILAPAAVSSHNLFLQIGAEMGVLGILFVVGFFVAYFLEVRGALRRVQDEQYRAILMALLATIPALFVHSFFELSAIIGAGSYTVFFWLSAALFQAIKRIQSQEATTEKMA